MRDLLSLYPAACGRPCLASRLHEDGRGLRRRGCRPLARAAMHVPRATRALIGFSFPSFDAFRWPHDRHYFEKRADELGLRYIIQGANEDVAT